MLLLNSNGNRRLHHAFGTLSIFVLPALLLLLPMNKGENFAQRRQTGEPIYKTYAIFKLKSRWFGGLKVLVLSIVLFRDARQENLLLSQWLHQVVGANTTILRSDSGRPVTAWTEHTYHVREHRTHCFNQWAFSTQISSLRHLLNWPFHQLYSLSDFVSGLCFPAD